MKGLLLETILSLLENWYHIFPQDRTAYRAVMISLSLYLATERKTLSETIRERGLAQNDWSADYRLFSRVNWAVCDVFRPMLKKAMSLVDDSIIAVGYDDTLMRKTGKKIKSSSWLRDPLSPPFNCNFVWGLRYLQASLLLPLYKEDQTPPRAIPIQLSQLPKFKKPRRNSPPEQWEQYQELRKKHNASTEFVKQLRYLRNELNEMGYSQQLLLAVVDGSYCNTTCLLQEIPNTHVIGRTRKDARLCHRSFEPRRFYSAQTFTAEQVRQDTAKPYTQAKIYYGGDWRELRYKEIKDVYWKRTKRKPLRLIVIAPTPYRLTKNSRLNYHLPAYLLTTDLTTSAPVLIQKYFDRWQIEVNFQEEKSIMGFGRQQVWSEKSIPRMPAFVVASYSSLILSSVLAFKDKRTADIFELLPKWRNKEPKRPSCRDLLTLVRKELAENYEILHEFDLRMLTTERKHQCAS
ncbi:MAG: hypothetical protein ACXVB4_04295 [Pseudobdellovibrionaceae bacterium]